MNPASQSWMSFRAVQWVLDNIATIQPASSGELLTLIAIASYSDTNGQNSRPSNQQLMDRTGLTKRVVQLHTATLVERGVISKQVDTTGLSTNAYDIAGMRVEKVEKAEGVLSVAGGVTDSIPPMLHTASPHATHDTPPMLSVAGEGVLPVAPTYIVKDQYQINQDQTHTNGARASASAPSLRSQLTLLAPDVGWSSFKEWWTDVWSIYPKDKRVDKPAAERVARAISPADWKRVYKAVQNYNLSSIVLRGYARNAVNFFADDNWVPYEDEPIIDKAEVQHTATSLRRANAGSQANRLANVESLLNGRQNGNGGYPNGHNPTKPKQLT